MEDAEKKMIKVFPLKLESTFSEEIDAFVFYTKTETKREYILTAIKEKIERDKVYLKDPQQTTRE